MDRFVINGGKSLYGTVRISGAKNATLPIMAASLLVSGTTVLNNVPKLRDIDNMSSLLKLLGGNFEYSDDRLTLNNQEITKPEAPYDIVKTMRASFYVLGPLLARCGRARVSLPGGCAWGPRPVDLHLKGMEALGATVELDEGYIVATAKKLQGAKIVFEISSVGATGNVMMAAVLAKGTTVIENAACEPDIVALANFLVKMGAHIDGIGTKRLEIEGVDSLSPVEDTMIPDRIEAGTFIIACGITGGEITVENVKPEHLRSVKEKSIDAGLKIIERETSLQIKSDDRPSPVSIRTAAYPGFPTDLQAQWMAWMSLADGHSTILETVYPDRFTHLAELRRMGADVILQGNTAFIRGREKLQAAPVMSTDIRASACLVLAGLAAEGRTTISRVYHIDRGFQHIEKKLQSLGADILREEDTLPN